MNRLLVCLIPLLPTVIAAQDNNATRGGEAVRTEAVRQEGKANANDDWQQVAPIPDCMDRGILYALSDEPHNSSVMMRELHVFPKPGLYRVANRKGPSLDALDDGDDDHVTLKVVRGRFVVQSSHDDRRENRQISVWTWDGKLQTWRYWVLAPSGSIELRGDIDEARQLIQFESIANVDEAGGSVAWTYSLAHEDRYSWKAQYRIDGQTRKVWQGDAERIGEVHEEPKDNGRLIALISVGASLIVTAVIVGLCILIPRRLEAKPGQSHEG
ncbi:MAG: hypothetical protein O3A00_27920 [Planctomycetota bacterium]|nr:hypothetical protein [Planctomycetota bacterium]